jgi:hypothetical protein
VSQKRRLQRAQERARERSDVDDKVRRIQALRAAVLDVCAGEDDAGVVQLALLDCALIVTRMAAQLAGDDPSSEAATRELIDELTGLQANERAEQVRLV